MKVLRSKVSRPAIAALSSAVLAAGCSWQWRNGPEDPPGAGAADYGLYALEGSGGTVERAVFSPMSNLLVTLGADGIESSTIMFWNAATGASLDSFPNESFLDRDVAFSDDGDLLGIGSRTVFLLDSSTLELRRVFEPEIYEDLEVVDINRELAWPNVITHYRVLRRYHFVTSISFSPDGRYLVSGHDNAIVKVWETGSGELLNSLSMFRVFGMAMDVEFSPDGRHIAACQDDEEIHLWRFPDYRKSTLEGHDKGIYALEFNPMTGELASAGAGGEIRFWDMESKRTILRIEASDRYINTLAFSEDGNHIACGGDGGAVRIFDASTGAPVATVLAGGPDVRSVALNSNSTLLAAGLDDGTVKVLDISALRLCRNLALTPVPLSPARIFCDARLEDAGGDGSLSAGELGVVRIIVENAGEGTAYNLVTQIRIRPEGSGTVTGEIPMVPMLLPGRTREIPVSIEGKERAAGAILEIRIFESNGFHLARPVTLPLGG